MKAIQYNQCFFSGCPNERIGWRFLYKAPITRISSYFGADSAIIKNHCLIIVVDQTCINTHIIIHGDEWSYSFGDEFVTTVVANFLTGQDHFITVITPETGETGSSTNFTSLNKYSSIQIQNQQRKHDSAMTIRCYSMTRQSASFMHERSRNGPFRKRLCGVNHTITRRCFFNRCSYKENACVVESIPMQR